MRVKICGITRAQDALAAVAAGADAIGLVFATSPRRVTISQARSIVRALPPFFPAIGVFVDARPATVLRTVTDVGLSAAQLHGDEGPDFVAKLGGVRVIKALRVRDHRFADQVARYASAGVAAILLDAFSQTARGGSGKRFDWDLLAGAQAAGAMDQSPPLILAGGLTEHNVRAAVRRVRPWAVDVSSGVESSPGIKSAERIARFIAAAKMEADIKQDLRFQI